MRFYCIEIWYIMVIHIIQTRKNLVGKICKAIYYTDVIHV